MKQLIPLDNSIFPKRRRVFCESIRGIVFNFRFEARRVRSPVTILQTLDIFCALTGFLGMSPNKSNRPVGSSTRQLIMADGGWHVKNWNLYIPWTIVVTSHEIRRIAYKEQQYVTGTWQSPENNACLEFKFSHYSIILVARQFSSHLILFKGKPFVLFGLTSTRWKLITLKTENAEDVVSTQWFPRGTRHAAGHCCPKVHRSLSW